MIIKIFLIVAILIIMVWFLGNRTTHQVRAWQKLGILLITLLGIFVVIFPETSNTVAHKFGVGRGADLLLYLLTIAFLLTVLNLYLKGKEEERRIVYLARKVAILEANAKNKQKLIK
jgi:small membrane protein